MRGAQPQNDRDDIDLPFVAYSCQCTLTGGRQPSTANDSPPPPPSENGTRESARTNRSNAGRASNLNVVPPCPPNLNAQLSISTEGLHPPMILEIPETPRQVQNARTTTEERNTQEDASSNIPNKNCLCDGVCKCLCFTTPRVRRNNGRTETGHQNDCQCESEKRRRMPQAEVSGVASGAQHPSPSGSRNKKRRAKGWQAGTVSNSSGSGKGTGKGPVI